MASSSSSPSLARNLTNIPFGVNQSHFRVEEYTKRERKKERKKKNERKKEQNKERERFSHELYVYATERGLDD